MSQRRRNLIVYQVTASHGVYEWIKFARDAWFTQKYTITIFVRRETKELLVSYREINEWFSESYEVTCTNRNSSHAAKRKEHIWKWRPAKRVFHWNIARFFTFKHRKKTNRTSEINQKRENKLRETGKNNLACKYLSEMKVNHERISEPFDGFLNEADSNWHFEVLKLEKNTILRHERAAY